MERADSEISRLVRDLGMENALRLHRIKARWDGLMGQPLSLHTSPAGLRDDTLLVNVSSPAWLQQLSFLKREMTDKLRPLGVKDIRLKLGRVKRRHEDAPPSVITGVSGADRAFIEELLSSVGDQGLKQSIRRAAEKWAASASARRGGWDA